MTSRQDPHSETWESSTWHGVLIQGKLAIYNWRGIWAQTATIHSREREGYHDWEAPLGHLNPKDSSLLYFLPSIFSSSLSHFLPSFLCSFLLLFLKEVFIKYFLKINISQGLGLGQSHGNLLTKKRGAKTPISQEMGTPA